MDKIKSSKVNFSVLITSALILSACGGSSSTSGGIPTDTIPAAKVTTINTYALNSSSVAVNNVVPINAGVNNGDFNINWNVYSSDPYRVEISISSDTALDNGDVKIFEQNCGAVSVVYNCNTIGSFTCRFTSDNKMSCGTVSSFNQGKDLTTFLTALPQRAFMVIKACDGLLEDCKTSSVEVELQ